MKYYVRTTGERDLSGYSVLDYTPLYDYEHKPLESYIKQLRIISNDDAVFMEDDIILCRDFQKKIEEVIARRPHQIINFYYLPESYYSPSIFPAKLYHWNQCVYYPKGIAKQIADKMDEIKEKNKMHHYDVLQGYTMAELHINFYSHRPCLVQHNGPVSLLGNSWHNDGKTPFFIDDLEDAGLDYNDTQKMVKLLKEWKNND